MPDYPEQGQCAICGNEYTRWGNNPQPFLKKFEQRVCDRCNGYYVIPERVRRINREEIIRGKQYSPESEA
jgi:hypothetical protein